MNTTSKLIFAFAAILGASLAANQGKIDSLLLTQLESNPVVDILVSMKAGTADILASLNSRSFTTRTERSQAVYDALRARAEASQAPMQAWLNSRTRPVAMTTLWITNQISIHGADHELVSALAAREDVRVVYWDEPVHLDAPVEEGHAEEGHVPRALAGEWGVEKVAAPLVWSMPSGTNGSGITIANIDTGVRHTHEILRHNYANDGRSWFDPITRTQTPRDVRGHGTHVMGTIVGSNGYGVAPGAKWIACKGLDDQGSGASAMLIQCGQWLICPTDPNGNGPDCSKTPAVVANSWGGSGGRTLYDDMIAGWHASGIVPVFSNGNSGPGCSTAGGPGDRNVLGSGSTTDTDELSSFSGRGPSLFSEMKPDLSAPGSSVRSADPASDSSYSVKSGTSMACPHIAGAAALLLSRNPSLSYAQVKMLLQNNADRSLRTTGGSCGGIRDDVFPNHHFGHGRLNAHRAYQALLQM